MQLENDLLIQCSQCGNMIKIDKHELDYESSSYERNMGPEVMYEFHGDYDCPNCSNSVRFSLYGSEYPIGAFNYQNHEIIGGFFVQSPILEVIFDYELNDETIEFIIPTIADTIYQIQNNPEYIYELTPREFEEVVAEIFSANGYEVTLTQETRDGGKDIIVKQMVMGSPFVMFIECKQYNAKNKVSVNIIRELCGIQTEDKVNKAMVVTSSFFSKDAIAFAEKRGSLLGLADFNSLMQWINNYR